MQQIEYRQNEGWGGLSDEQLVPMALRGEKTAVEALLTRCRPWVAVRARKFKGLGPDGDDIIQEGMLGVYEAIRQFDVSRRSMFRPFAEICAYRRMVTAIRGDLRQQPQSHHECISFDQPHSGPGKHALAEIVADEVNPTPEQSAMDAVFPRTVRALAAEHLSALEKQALAGFLRGQTYAEMSATLGVGSKAVDNALQRVRRKFSVYQFE